ncbi:aak-1 [Symbiodinium microadriaticum]|nr:aak-1 [Symbiodinium microadriaticum]CAE7945540.1 aak-1 [Symbiodinium sp. KB8]
MADATTKLLVEGLPPSVQTYAAPFIELGVDMLDWVTRGSLSDWCCCGEIDPYMLYTTLGTGSFGVVQHGVHRSLREEVAVKRILKSGIRDIQQMANELDVLDSAKHKNLCQMLELLDTPDFLYIVLPYASQGDMAKCLSREKEQRFPLGLAFRYFEDIAAGVAHLHEHNIGHRDMKPENVLIHHQTALVSDFGCACWFTPGEVLTSSPGTVVYAAAEMVAKPRHGGQRGYVLPFTDLWSLGVTLFEMLSGARPFRTFQQLQSARYTLPDFVAPCAAHLIASLIRLKPQERMSAAACADAVKLWSHGLCTLCSLQQC